MTSVEVASYDHSTSCSVAVEVTYREKETGERQASNCTRHRLKINKAVISNYVCIRPITIYSDQYYGFLFTCPVCFSYSSMVWRKGAGEGGSLRVESRFFFRALQVLLWLHTEMIRRIKQQQRQVEYIHMRYNPPNPPTPLFPLICYPRTSSK